MTKNQSKLNMASITTLVDAMSYWARTTPDAPAWWIEHGEGFRAISWKEIEQASLSLADLLLANVKTQPARNVGDSRLSEIQHCISDRIMSYLPNGIEWAIVDLACQLLGLVHVPIDRRIPERKLDEYRMRIKPITEVVSSFNFDDLVGRSSSSGALSRHLERHRPKGSAVATILYTSGTSGRAEGVMLSHDNLIQNAWAKLEAVPQSPQDRRLNILPFAHAYARTCELSTWLLSGSSMICVGSYDQMLSVAPVFRPTLINAVPYHFQKLRENIVNRHGTIATLEKPLKEWLGESLRILASGGAGLSDEVFSFFEKFGFPIIQGYGLTEASPVICSNCIQDPKSNCVGRPVKDTDVFIDDEQRLFVKGPGVMVGYWDNPEATARRIRNGWLDTGDRAKRLPDGSIRILGRCDDRLVLSTGDKIDPLLVENLLVEIASIDQLVLVGNHEKFVSAVVSTKENNEQAMLKAIQSVLVDWPAYTVPKRLVLTDDTWSLESGLLNHKGAVIRSAVLKKYQLRIGQLYHPSLGRRQESLEPSQGQQDTKPSNQDRDGIQQ
jgi:long-chain acyl-CoA synthetase